MKQPNLFIVGAPRCGTTAMFNYLGQHPDICVLSYKEPHYFGKDLCGERFTIYRDRPKRYQALFRHASNEKWICEASVGYLFSKTAAEEIREFNPASRIMIMLRNPVDALFSMYKQARFTGSTTYETFEDMITEQTEFPVEASVETAQRLLTVEGVRYGEQVERYYVQFKPEQIHVILYDEFRQNTETIYQETLKYLEIDDRFRPEAFEIINASQENRFPVVGGFLRSPLLVKMGGLIPQFAVPIYRVLKQKNSKPLERETASRSIRDSLLRQLKPDIEHLSHIISRDLSHWM